MTTRLLTVTRSPENGGTRARRMAAAMHPPVAVPANGGPLTFALMALPELANVTVTVAVPDGSLPRRQDDAAPAAVRRAATAAPRSKGAPAEAAGLSVLATGVVGVLVVAGSLPSAGRVPVEALGSFVDAGCWAPATGSAAAVGADWSCLASAVDAAASFLEELVGVGAADRLGPRGVTGVVVAAVLGAAADCTASG